MNNNISGGLTLANYQRVVNDNDYKVQVHQFLTNVFKQVDIDKFQKLFEDVVSNSKDGETVYSELLKRSDEAKGSILWKIQHQFHALKTEKSTLADNLAKLFDPQQSFKGYTEILFPGRMIRYVKQIAGQKGDCFTVIDGSSITDLIQSGWPRPQQATIKLNDYASLDSNFFQEKKVEIISAFPGLHHCPPDKLETFVASIAESLPEWGVFLLRDHDADNLDMVELAAMAHSLFNAFSGVSCKDEKNEVRNFHGLNYWINLLKENNLYPVSDPNGLIRDGDSSKNALIKFVKLPEDMQNEENQLRLIREHLIGKHSHYLRPLVQTYFTKTEWANVEEAVRESHFNENGNFWDYAYCSDALRTLLVYKRSWSQARKVESFTNLFFSSYNLMNVFIATTTSISSLVRGLAYSPLRWASKCAWMLPHDSNDVNWKSPSRLYGEWMNEYSTSIHVIPSYAQPFLPFITNYWKTMKETWIESRKTRGFFSMLTDRQTIKNIITGLAMTADLGTRMLAASPVNMFYGGVDAADDREIGVIIQKPPESVENIDNRIKCSVIDDNNQFVGIVVPRYGDLEQILKIFADKNIQVMEIAGQKEIQIDFDLDTDTPLPNDLNITTLYEEKSLDDPNKKIVTTKVAVNQLSSVLKELGEQMRRIYDY